MREEGPLISVILPVYNVEQYLPRCMESLFRQTWKNLELVLVDDGSREECAALCDEYGRRDARVAVYHKTNGGLSDARNYGIRKSRGEYITFVDSDDYVDPDYVEYLYNLIEQYGTKLSICQHRVVYPGGGGHSFGTNGDELLSDKECIRRMLYFDGVFTYSCAKLFHRSLLDGIEFPMGKLFEDVGTTYKLMLGSRWVALGYEAKYNYFQRDDSICRCSFHPGKLDLLEMSDRMARDVVGRYPDLKAAAVRHQVYSRFSTLNQMLDADEPELKREMAEYIRKHRWQVMKDKKAPQRDKIAILALALGLPVYTLFWTVYSKGMVNRSFKWKIS